MLKYTGLVKVSFTINLVQLCSTKQEIITFKTFSTTVPLYLADTTRSFNNCTRRWKLLVEPFSMLFNAGIKLYGFINHFQSRYPPSPSKRGRTLKLSMTTLGFFKISFCSALWNSKECLTTRESRMLLGKPVATSRNN